MTTHRPTLTIRVGSTDETKADFHEKLAAMEAGEDVEDMHVLNLEDRDALEQLFRATNIDLLEAIARDEPSSIRAAADLVDRGHKEVLNNIEELEQLGLIELVQDGRAKRPRAKYSRLEVEMSLPVRDEPAPA